MGGALLLLALAGLLAVALITVAVLVPDSPPTADIPRKDSA